MFIPAGRTSLVKRGDTMLQVQTEYAYRPYPRITTTILNSGQVVHKLEKKLERPIESIEEQNLAENVIKKQHHEVLALISDPTGVEKKKMEMEQDEPTIIQHGKKLGHKPPTAEQTKWQDELTAVPDLTNQQKDTDDSSARPYPSSTPPPVAKESLQDRFGDIPDFEHAFALTVDGYFKTATAEENFKQRFKSVYKCLADVINVFPEVRGTLSRREEGVFEVERNRLYLASTGEELFFISVTGKSPKLNYERVIRNILFPDEIEVFLKSSQRQQS